MCFRLRPAREWPDPPRAGARPTITGASAPNPYTLQVHRWSRRSERGCSSMTRLLGRRGRGYKSTSSGRARRARGRSRARRREPRNRLGARRRGRGPGGQPLLVGSTPRPSTLTCYTAVDVFLAGSVVFESGFETPYLSRNRAASSAQLRAGPDHDGSCGTMLGGAPGPDCTTRTPRYIPAPRSSGGDGLNNDCNAPAGPPRGDERGRRRRRRQTECAGICNDGSAASGHPGRGARRRLHHHTALGWKPPPLAGRHGGRPTTNPARDRPSAFMSATCLDTDGLDTPRLDGVNPPACGRFFYLVRAQNTAARARSARPRAAAARGRSCPDPRASRLDQPSRGGSRHLRFDPAVRTVRPACAGLVAGRVGRASARSSRPPRRAGYASRPGWPTVPGLRVARVARDQMRRVASACSSSPAARAARARARSRPSRRPPSRARADSARGPARLAAPHRQLAGE